MNKIAIQGIPGSFHHEAAEKIFGPSHQWVACMTFPELTDHVAEGRAGYGLMAVENSLVGGMLPNFSLVREASLHVTGELYMRISQNLMALPGTHISELKEVHSHPMALMQSEHFFRKLPHIRLIESADTALSARDIAERQLIGIGAVGSKKAAALYGLKLLAESIETDSENYTRFWVLSKTEIPAQNNVPVKASVAFVAPHQSGSLANILQPIANAGINLSMLQSLPLVGKSWEYVFHADMLCQNRTEALYIIRTLQERLSQLWIMGIYPQKTSHIVAVHEEQSVWENNSHKKNEQITADI
jgi:prephenate dehydratase